MSLLPEQIRSDDLTFETDENLRAKNHQSDDFLNEALTWFEFGLSVIPVSPGTKKTSVKWDAWLDGLSEEKIKLHWIENPNHEVGCIVGNDIVVLDADGPESEEALSKIELEHNVPPKLASRTMRGRHDFFMLEPGTFAKTDSHSTELYPARIDVKTGRSLIILPPSVGKSILNRITKHVSDITVVDQQFIDNIFIHNGRPVPREFTLERLITAARFVDDESLKELSDVLTHISADCGYEDWLRVLMAIFHETNGSDDGLHLADQWCKDGKTYKGINEVASKWLSFKGNTDRPVTIGTLKRMAGMQSLPIKTIDTNTTSENLRDEKDHPLLRFSLLGRSEEIENEAVLQEPLLGEIALKGQATVIYAAPNTGKTLITLSLLVQGISKSLLDPAKIFYINVDDSGAGLVEKTRLADEYGFHMLAEGHAGFQSSMFIGILAKAIEDDAVRGMVIILDTLKKFTNLMDKVATSRFTKVIRAFVLKGGSLVALAHTNKNRSKDGKPVYGGTSDILDDIDCGYTLAEVPQNSETGTKVVVFENIKKRGHVAATVAYRYATGKCSYSELLLSVQPVDVEHIGPLQQAAEILSDTEIIEAIRACMRDGICSKMKLAEAAAVRAKVSKRVAIKMLEKYTGADPMAHHWSFKVQERGAKVYVLLNESKAPSVN